MKKRTLCQLLFAAAALLSSHLTTAQIYNAANPDNIAGLYNGPPEATNIGNAVVHFRSGEMKAFVYDGNTPQLAWSHSNIGIGKVPIAGSRINLGTLTDPDVVLNPTGGVETALITYLLGDQVYYEVQVYNPGPNTFNLLVGPTKVNSGTDPCHSPNVDVNENGKAVIVYGQAVSGSTSTIHRVYTRSTDLNNAVSGLNPIYEFIPNTTHDFKALKPDVAVYKDWVHVVYIYEDIATGDKDVNIKREDLNDVNFGGTSSSTSSFDYPYQSPTSSSNVGAPRIAAPAPNLGGLVDDWDFQAVVQVDKTIVGLNRYLVNGSGLTSAILNNVNGLSQCEVFNPVVSYLYDMIIVAWNQVFCPALGMNTKEVVARKLTFGGTPVSTGVSIVNFDRTLAYYQTALDGRYHNTEALYTFTTSYLSRVLYKSSHFTNNSLRIASASNSDAVNKASLSVFPNPVSKNATVQINLAADETANSLEVFNLTGQQVANISVAGLEAGTNSLTWNPESTEMPAGIYMLKLTTNKAVVSLKIRKD